MSSSDPHPSGSEPGLSGDPASPSPNAPALGGARGAAQLVEALKEAGYPDRAGLLAQLGGLRDRRALPPLLTLLSHPNAHVRREAAKTIGYLAEPEAIPALIAALDDPHIGVRANVALALGMLGLGSPDFSLRDQAADALCGRLHDRDPFVRVAAARYLRRIGPLMDPGPARDRLIDSLIPALNDPDSRVSAFAAEGLGAIRDRRGLRGLIEVAGDSSVGVRSMVGNALRRIIGEMDPVALSDLILPALIDALLTASPPSRSVAAFALGAVNAAQLPPAGRDGLVSGLVAALKDEDWTVRRAAALALGDTRDARALSPLLALLRDDDSAVRGCAAYALGWTLPWHEGHALSPRIVDGLIGLLSDPEELIPPVYQHDRVGAAAADSLRQIGDRRGLEAVRAWEGS